MIGKTFGSFRGLVRLGLSYIQVVGRQAEIYVPAPEQVRRLVFVCHGNICRSAFADVVAHREGLRATSFGLSTSSGSPAHPPAAAAASALGIALNAHRTTRVEDYAPQDGDLLLAMEVRQLQHLAADARLNGLPRTLLGLYAKPAIPHLHDPYKLGQAYMAVCLTRIEGAVKALGAAFPGSKSGG